MGCAASAEGTQPSTTALRTEDAKSDKKVPEVAAAPANQQANTTEAAAPTPPARAPDTNPTPSVATAIHPPTIAGYPVNTYTDGGTRVAVKCVILSRQKCETVCRFLDSVRKARDRNGGYFRNPEEPIEVENRRDAETASAASGRSKLEPSMSAVHNNSVTGHGMNVSMAVHAGQTEALSPSPHGALATVPDISSGNTPAKGAAPERVVATQIADKGNAATTNNEPTGGKQGQKSDGDPIPGSVVETDGPM